MQFSVTFRHMDASDAVRQYAREKVDKIKKYVPDPIDVHIQLHNGLAIKGHETSEDMYSSIDLVMDKIERQVRRYKERIRHHKAKEGLSELWEHVIEGPAHDAEQTGKAADATPTPVAKPKITKTEKFAAQDLRVDEAVMQLDLQHQSFLVFRNHDTGQISVVYRREDGHYGLIETAQPS
jgi:putative sigma-54 modulation protein